MSSVYRYKVLCLAMCAVSPAAAQTLPAGVIDVPSEAFPWIGERESIGSNTTLNINVGGDVDKFLAAGTAGVTGTEIEVNVNGGFKDLGWQVYDGSTLNVRAGGVGSFGNAHSGSFVNISGGSVGLGFDAFHGATVDISGGVVGDLFEAFSFSTVRISGGYVGSTFGARLDSTVTITGGIIGEGFNVVGAYVLVSGGSIGADLDVFPGSEIALVGTEFLLDGVPMDLEFGLPTAVLDRDVRLSGRLLDGSVFEFDLFSTDTVGEDFFSPNATLTVTLIPEPSSGVLVGLLATAAFFRSRVLSRHQMRRRRSG